MGGSLGLLASAMAALSLLSPSVDSPCVPQAKAEEDDAPHPITI